MSAVLEFRHVTGINKKFALADVSFTLEKGYIMGLAGRNGAGKTTLLNYILSEAKLYNGEIYLAGEDIRKDRVWTMDHIGLVSEGNQFFADWTVGDNAARLGAFYSKWDGAYFEEQIGAMGISMDKRIKHLSRGEYMKFQMAFAMAHQPSLYLLDEATAGMDPVYRREFFQLLLSVIEQEKASVLMTTHSKEELSKRTDYIGILDQGSMISFGENREGVLV